MLVLVFGWCEHVQCAVAPSCVVPDFDVVVDCAGLVFQRLRLSNSTCMRAQNALTIALLSYGAPTAPIEGARPASRIFWLKAALAVPVSELAHAAEDEAQVAEAVLAVRRRLAASRACMRP